MKMLLYVLLNYDLYTFGLHNKQKSIVEIFIIFLIKNI